MSKFVEEPFLSVADVRSHEDVPENYLEQLGHIWKLESTDYIDGVPALYTTRGTRFDGVFTKLSVTWLKDGMCTRVNHTCFAAVVVLAVCY